MTDKLGNKILDPKVKDKIVDITQEKKELTALKKQVDQVKFRSRQPIIEENNSYKSTAS